MKTVRAGILMAIILSLCAGTAFAIPSLQLNIGGGFYVGGTDETIYSSSKTFDLYAYLIPTTNGSPNLLTDTYYVSAALVPQTVEPGGSYGSFTFAGSSVNVTGGMVYGTPPLETLATQLGDPGDLAPHGIFETYFQQFDFTFGEDQVTPFNTQDQPGFLGDAGTGMYYKKFAVNVNGLDPGYSIHFDLYNSKILEAARNPNVILGDVDVNNFAPFSHDAQSDGRGPEAGALLLFGTGLIGLVGYRRVRRMQ